MSKIVLVEHKQIDKTRWDNLIDLSPYSFPYWRSWYLDVVSPGWKAIIYDNYSYVLPLPFRKKAGIKYVFPPDFTQQIGVFGVDFPPPEIISSMLEKATSSFRYLEFNLNYKNKIDFINGTLRKRKNYTLLLNDSFETISKRYHSNTKRNIKKSEKENLSLIVSQSPNELIETFKKHKAKQLNKKKGIDFKLLENLVETGIEKGAFEIMHIYESTNYLGGAIFANEGNRKVFLFSALTTDGRKKRAMFYLLDQVIRKNAESNKILDFEGSEDKNLGQFYQRFGAEESVYLHIEINRLPKLIKWLK